MDVNLNNVAFPEFLDVLQFIIQQWCVCAVPSPTL